MPIVLYVILLFLNFILASCQNGTEVNSNNSKHFIQMEDSVKQNNQANHIKDNPKSNIEVDSFAFFLDLFKREIEEYGYDDLKSKYFIETNHLNMLPKSLALRYIKMPYYDDYIGILSDSMQEHDNYNLVFFTIPCIGGGQCMSSYVASFDFDGNMLSNLLISGIYDGYYEKTEFKSYFTRRNITVEYNKKKLDENQEILEDITKHNEYYIDKNGYIQSNSTPSKTK